MSETDLVSGDLLKKLLLSHFISDWDEIWQHCFSSKYVSMDFQFDVTLLRTWP